METPAKPFPKSDALLFVVFTLLGVALIHWFFIEATNPPPSHVNDTSITTR